MSYEQGLYSFPGVVKPMEGSYTQAHGTRPDPAVLGFVPQVANIAAGGLLQFTFTGFPSLDLPGCRVDFGTLHVTEDGQLMRVNVLDRRWKWQSGGEITGLYNIRDADGVLVPPLIKTARELAGLLFDAMGEVSRDITLVPEDVFPEVEWVCSHPATELDRLCDQIGFRVVLGYSTDPPKLWPIGTGSALPNDSDVQTVSFGVDPPELPDSLKVCGGESQWESLFELEAVGLDTDGQVRPIVELSYNPALLKDPYASADDLAAGWFTEEPRLFPTVAHYGTEEQYRLCRETVYRWYQITGLFDLVKPAGFSGTVDGIWQYLPLNSYRLGHGWYNDDPSSGRKVNLPPLLFGCYSRDSDGIEHLVNTKCESYDHGFTLRENSGIVRTSGYAYKYDVDNKGYLPAELYLVTSHGVKDKDSWIEDRRTLETSLGAPNGTGPKILHRPDIVRTVVQNFTCSLKTGPALTTVDDNDADVLADMTAVTVAKLNEYQVLSQVSVRYRGLKIIDLDGAVRQVGYKVSNKTGCHTFASINSEIDPYVLTYREKRSIADRRADLRKARNAIRNYNLSRRRGST